MLMNIPHSSTRPLDRSLDKRSKIYKKTYSSRIAAFSSFMIVSMLAVPPTGAQTAAPQLTTDQTSETQTPDDTALPSFSIQPLPSAPVPQPLPSPPGPESAYTLGAGDIIRVDIFRVPQYSGESQVLIDGSLNLPLVGKVNVNGLTLESAADALSGRYGQYLRRPIITLSLLNRRPLQISIAGEVSRPGSYTIDQGSTQSSRLSQLLETAGGITQSADLSQVAGSLPAKLR